MTHDLLSSTSIRGIGTLSYLKRDKPELDEAILYIHNNIYLIISNS